ncbi:hypothetical protein GH741_08875 [Aquibacillus halophilus]|uniref:Uncharacterized protein n=1 Tax=Aquibacillus halophilus TaxID=930132 RepID=A0A6A8DG19_9BACI|nr:hypothetical protein [Aquibacillus halophilus]MRH42799.1 hypothetical protein [Aquibacillus halophilus]
MKRLSVRIILVLFVMIASGCSSEEDKTELFFFADFPTTITEDVKSILVEGIEGSTADDFEVSSLPMYHEKIYAELAGKHGDIYIIRQVAIEGIKDPIGFSKLDEIIDPELVTDEYKGVNPDTGDEHVYVVPIDNDSLLLRKLGVELDIQLAAFIPKFSDNQEESIRVLKYLLEKQ